MSELKKTIALGGLALALALLAIATKPRPIEPDAFVDRGDAFFPNLDDPAKAASLEVIEYDEQASAARPFRVAVQKGLWTIPSHHDYPADGLDRLAQTAAAIIELKKEDFTSASVGDHIRCGVVDPLEEIAENYEGRGRRVTLKGANDEVLADIIVGNELTDRPGYHFVRVPGEKRIYVARLDAEISNNFQDWIEKDLLGIERDAIEQVTIHDYSINENTASIEERDVVALTKSGSTWSMAGLSDAQEVDATKMSALVGAIDELQIIGVRPKPDGLTQNLKQSEQGIRISQADLLSLQSRGYYMTQDGSLKSNEGDVQVLTNEGILYTLRFGEVVYGDEEAVSAGSDKSDDSSAGPGENRYLFITAELGPELSVEPPQPSNREFETKPEDEWTDEDRDNRDLETQHAEWVTKVDMPRKIVAEQNARFAGWYYVISSATYDKINLKRAGLVKAKEA